MVPMAAMPWLRPNSCRSFAPPPPLQKPGYRQADLAVALSAVDFSSLPIVSAKRQTYLLRVERARNRAGSATTRPPKRAVSPAHSFIRPAPVVFRRDLCRAPVTRPVTRACNALDSEDEYGLHKR